MRERERERFIQDDIVYNQIHSDNTTKSTQKFILRPFHEQIFTLVLKLFLLIQQILHVNYSKVFQSISIFTFSFSGELEALFVHTS